MKRQRHQYMLQYRAMRLIDRLAEFSGVSHVHILQSAGELGIKRWRDLVPLTPLTATRLLERQGVDRTRIAAFIARPDFGEIPKYPGASWGTIPAFVPKVYRWPHRSTVHVPVIQSRNREERVAFYSEKVKQQRDLPFVTRLNECLAQERTWTQNLKEAQKQGDELTAFHFGDLANEAGAASYWLERDVQLQNDYPQVLELWKTLPRWNPDQRSKISPKLDSLHPWLELIANNLDCTDHHSAVLGLALICFAVLEELAKRGSKPAAKAYIEGTTKITRRLNELTRTRATVMRTLFKEFKAWPVLESPQRRFRDYPRESLSHLRGGLNLEIYDRAKWDPADPATQVAMQLLEHVTDFQSTIRRSLKEERYRHRRNLPLLTRRVLALPRFSRKTARIWWDVARKCFKEGCPNPYANHDCRHLVYSQRTEGRDLKRKIAKLSLADRNARIMENIHDKFISLAGRHKEGAGSRYPLWETPIEDLFATQAESLDAKIEKLQEEHGHEF